MTALQIVYFPEFFKTSTTKSRSVPYLQFKTMLFLVVYLSESILLCREHNERLAKGK